MSQPEEIGPAYLRLYPSSLFGEDGETQTLASLMRLSRTRRIGLLRHIEKEVPEFKKFKSRIGKSKGGDVSDLEALEVWFLRLSYRRFSFWAHLFEKDVFNGSRRFSSSLSLDHELIERVVPGYAEDIRKALRDGDLQTSLSFEQFSVLASDALPIRKNPDDYLFAIERIRDDLDLALKESKESGTPLKGDIASAVWALATVCGWDQFLLETSQSNTLRFECLDVQDDSKRHPRFLARAVAISMKEMVRNHPSPIGNCGSDESPADPHESGRVDPDESLPINALTGSSMELCLDELEQLIRSVREYPDENLLRRGHELLNSIEIMASKEQVERDRLTGMDARISDLQSALNGDDSFSRFAKLLDHLGLKARDLAGDVEACVRLSIALQSAMDLLLAFREKDRERDDAEEQLNDLVQRKRAASPDDYNALLLAERRLRTDLHSKQDALSNCEGELIQALSKLSQRVDLASSACVTDVSEKAEAGSPGPPEPAFREEAGIYHLPRPGPTQCDGSEEAAGASAELSARYGGQVIDAPEITAEPQVRPSATVELPAPREDEFRYALGRSSMLAESAGTALAVVVLEAQADFDVAVRRLAAGQEDHREKDLERMAALQWTCLVRRQPLRSMLLAYAVTDLDGAVSANIAPEWLCRILLLVSDARAPLSEEECNRISIQLYQVRTLPDRLKELVVLWLSAELLGNRGEKAVRVARLVPPQQFGLDDLPVAKAFAEHIVKPVYNGSAFVELTDSERGVERVEQCLARAREIIDPARNNYQNASVRALWRKLTVNSGPLGKLFHDAEQARYPRGNLSVEELVEEDGGWAGVVSSYKHNMESRIESFIAALLEARSAHISVNLASSGSALLSRSTAGNLLENLEGIGYDAWWIDQLRVSLGDVAR